MLSWDYLSGKCWPRPRLWVGFAELSPRIQPRDDPQRTKFLMQTKRTGTANAPCLFWS